MTNTIKMVIGSWGSYNECNERALGSKWLNFDYFDDWEDIEEELKKEGFELDGIDEELFVQDVEGMPDNDINWDYVNPKTIFELMKKSGVLDEQRKYDIMLAYCEVRSFEEWKRLVENNEDNWDDGIYLYPNYTWEDYGRMTVQEFRQDLPEDLYDFFDFENYGQYMGGDNAYEYSDGIVEILR